MMEIAHWVYPTNAVWWPLDFNMFGNSQQFSVPQNFVDKWKDAIPYFNKSSYVFSRHFDESHIEKGKEI